MRERDPFSFPAPSKQECEFCQTQVFQTQTFLAYIHVNFFTTSLLYALQPLGYILFWLLSCFGSILVCFQGTNAALGGDSADRLCGGDGAIAHGVWDIVVHCLFNGRYSPGHGPCLVLVQHYSLLINRA